MSYIQRKHTRFPGFDYSSQRYYFVTICTHDRNEIFGLPNSQTLYGKIAERHLLNTPEHFSDVKIDYYVIMPNHIHAIIVIGCDGEAERSRPFPTLSTIVGLYKSGVSKDIRLIDPSIRVWQKSFIDKIIRNKGSYRAVCSYIIENPQKWNDGMKNDF